MSPGSLGAKRMFPPWGGAVKVFMKNDSPPSSERFRPFRAPPWVEVSISVPVDMASMAPPSAFTRSPPARVTLATA